MSQPFETISGDLYRLLTESSQRSSRLHHQFLKMRESALCDVKDLLALQIQASQDGLVAAARSHPVPQALFDSYQLDAFGTGSISQCFGPAFAAYDRRRIPRIPNGALKMMSRIVQIEGEPRRFSVPASITAEYDVPSDAWYIMDSAYPDLPVSVWMEIALQPCGFLSAYLDTYAVVPQTDFFFRNLDGAARLVNRVDLRGKTITTRARMVTSVVSAGTVIQKFAFELSCAGRVVYQGESSFGYFSAESMANQVGLDNGKQAPWLANEKVEKVEVQRWKNARSGKPYLRLSQGKLNYLDEAWMSQTGGRYGQGYIYAKRPVNPADWFYPCHFYQDPVMPGSLGVEAIYQAMQMFALQTDLGAGLRSPHFGLPVGRSLDWRYRGQITPQHQMMELEVHLKTAQGFEEGVLLPGDASLWVDGLRIYEIKNAAVAILEG